MPNNMDFFDFLSQHSLEDVLSAILSVNCSTSNTIKIKDTMKSNATITLSATIPWMLPIMV